MQYTCFCGLVLCNFVLNWKQSPMTCNSLQNCDFYNGPIKVNNIFMYLSVPLLLDIKVIAKGLL